MLMLEHQLICIGWCAFIGRNDFVSEVLQQDAPEFYDLLYDWMADSLHNTLEM